MNKELKNVNDLLKSFHSNGINYCHWKSNEHLGASFKGDTDFDILFDLSQKTTIVSILKNHNFQKFNAPSWRSYKFIEDYIGIDEATGKIIHIHSHFGLVLGEKGLKSYKLPWETAIFESRIYNEKFEIYCSAPDYELLLLIIRITLKLDSIDQHNINDEEIQNYIRESLWLKKRVEFDSLYKLYENKVNDSEKDLLERIYADSFDFDSFQKLKSILKPKFKKHRRFAGYKAFWLRKIRKLLFYFSVALVKIKYKNLIPKRSLDHKGLIVSIMGADGSGKSSQTSAVYKELNKKIDVNLFYMGSGDGAKSKLRIAFQVIINLAKQIIGGKKGKETNGSEKYAVHNNSHNKPFYKEIPRIIFSLIIAFEKRTKLRKAKKAKNNGEIVICDRYPQSQIYGYNDGPRLTHLLKSNYIYKKISQFELSIYNKSYEIYPDLVFKLIGDPEVFFKRRTEMTIEEIVKKQEGIKKIKFSKDSEIIEINANLSLNEVRTEIMSIIGKKLLKNK